MLNTDGQRKIVVTGLKNYLGCKVVRTNQTAEMPAFPYLGYNITTLSSQNKGTYGKYEDNKARKPVVQTWSITAHSDNYNEAVELANKARDWLDIIGTQYLDDNNVIVQSVGNVLDRSNLLTSDYIYSQGFDCFFSMFDEIDLNEVNDGEIEKATIGEATAKMPPTEDELNELLEKRLDGE